MAQHRNSERISIKVQDHPALSLCTSDPAMRVMVLCSAGNFGVQEVAFPHQCELKVNGGDIKANLRGLKNKPGSTRPVDITDSLRLRPASYTNNVELTYALTQKVGAASHSKGSEVRIGGGRRGGFADGAPRNST
jgi:E3 SUMO-protein ligase PIAS1